MASATAQKENRKGREAKVIRWPKNLYLGMKGGDDKIVE